MGKRELILAFFALITVMGVVGSSGANVEAQEASEEASTETTGNEVVGAFVAHPEGWVVEREPYTLEGTYGYTLWRPESGASHDHGGTPAVRVALAYDLEPGRIEAEVRDLIAAYEPDLQMEREEVAVAGKGYDGVAVGTIPGSTPSTEVYVPVEGRVYIVTVYGETFDAADEELLSGIGFEPPSRTVESLGLPDANAPEALEGSGDPELTELEEAAREEASADALRTADVSAARVPKRGEKRINEGCWRAKSRFFVQTQHGKFANKNRYRGRRAGWTKIGQPNYWGEYTHGNLRGYGRCDKRRYTNDKFAIDYPLKKGDVIFSPFKRGKVTFAGRNRTHRDYGKFVSIRAGNGKYVSISTHLAGIKKGLRRGDRVTNNTIIGYAGNTDGPTISAGRVHLHQAFYRKPSFNRDGSPYGGAGLRIKYHHYVGTAAGDNGGIYRFSREGSRKGKTKGDWISN